MPTRRHFILALPGVVVVFGPWRHALAQHITSRRAGLPHPEPRPGVTGEHVLPESEIDEGRRVRAAYAAARAHPSVFDGVFCACGCDKSMNHRSLLSCFESRQAVGCMACREEGELVGRLVRDGKTLDEIRHAVDLEFGD